MSTFKKVLSSCVLIGVLVSGNVFAGGGHYYGHQHHHNSGNWVVPALVGGLVVYSMTQPRVVYSEPVYVQRAPVIMTPPPPQPLLAQNLPPVWYYCQSSQTYYPYVQNCHEGWKVVPAIPGS
jgi:hypothetical protein